MIGSVRMSGSGGDRSFLCLVAIYAAHVLLFHVLDSSTPRVSWPRDPANFYSANRRNGTLPATAAAGCCDNDANRTANASATEARLLAASRLPAADLGPSNLLTGQLGRKVFTSSNQFQKQDTIALLMTYPKVNLDFLLSVSFVNRLRNIFTTVALSSPTWGILSGCVIFLLTYHPDRENTFES